MPRHFYKHYWNVNWSHKVSLIKMFRTCVVQNKWPLFLRNQFINIRKLFSCPNWWKGALIKYYRYCLTRAIWWIHALYYRIGKRNDSTKRFKDMPYHYSDVIMTTIASQITSLTIVYSTVYSGRSKKTSKLRATGLCMGNSPGTGEFTAQMASNAENDVIM